MEMTEYEKLMIDKLDSIGKALAYIITNGSKDNSNEAKVLDLRLREIELREKEFALREKEFEQKSE